MIPQAAAMAAQAGVGVIQAGVGIAQSISGNQRLKRILQRREDYVSPELQQQQFQIAQNEAQSGYGAAAMSYFTGQTNNALTESLNTVSKLGGNANNISSIFSKNVDAIMKTNSDSEMMRVMKFDKLYASIAKVIEGKDAEFADRRAKHDDAMAVEAMKVKAGNENLKSGLNAITGAAANYATGQLGKNDITPHTGAVNLLQTQSAAAAARPLVPASIAPLGISSNLPAFNSTPDYGQLWQQIQRR